MKEALTEDKIKMIGQLAEAMKEEADEGLSLKENLQASLADRVDHTDGQKEVEEICRGIHDFDELLEQLESGGGKEQIMEAIYGSGLGDKSMDEQYSILAESLEGFQKDLEGKGYDLGGYEDLRIKKDGVIDENDLKELKNIVAEYLDQFSMLHAGTENMERFFHIIGAEVSEELLKAYEKHVDKYYVALAIYILQVQGEIDFIPLEMGAKGIGVSVSAAIASAKTYIGGILGSISQEEALDILKNIASAGLTLLAALAAGAIVYEVGQIVFLLSIGIWGYSLIGLAIAAVLTLSSQLIVMDFLCDLWEDIKENAADVKEYVLEKWEDVKEAASGAGEYAAEKFEMIKYWITEEALPALRSFWENVKEKIVCFIESHTHTKTGEEEELNNYEMEDEAVAFAEA